MFFIVWRYLFGRRSNNFMNNILIFLGISLTTAVLVIVLSVMNGFQFHLIENTIHVESQDIRVYTQKILNQSQKKVLYSHKNIHLVQRYAQTQGLIHLQGQSQVVNIRLSTHQGIEQQMHSAYFHLVVGQVPTQGNECLMSVDLAQKWGIPIGSLIPIIVLDTQNFKGKILYFHVVGIYDSQDPSFNAHWIWVPFGQLNAYVNPSNFYYGIDLKNGSESFSLLHWLKKTSIFPQAQYQAWQDYNYGFYYVLKLEKAMMGLIVSLIFILVGLNIVASFRRRFLQRIHSLVVFFSLGMSMKQFKKIFFLESAILGISALGMGLFIGYFISVYLHQILSIFTVGVVQMASMLHIPMSNAFLMNMAVFAQMTTKIQWQDLVYISIFVILLLLWIFYHFIKQLKQFKPMEILQNL